MKEPVENGTMINVQGLECWIPPVPDLDKIQGSLLSKRQQKWQRTPLPDIPVREIEVVSGEYYGYGEALDWESARREEIIFQTGRDPWNLDRHGNPVIVPGIIRDETFTFPVLEDFRRQELARCDPFAWKKEKTSGHWIMINGKPIYLTPYQYFYCNWWKLNVGYPQWRWVDCLRFYHWQYVMEDDVCLVEIEASKKGEGKTYRATCKQYLTTIYKNKCRSGIQSKTDTDAEQVFSIHLVEPYKDLPDFFIPINSNPTDPKRNLRFHAMPRAGKSAAANRVFQKRALRSSIDFRNAKDSAYDGATIDGVFIRDEEGKTIVANVSERHAITRNCVYRDGEVFGKIASTTTVDRWEKGGENFKKLWDFSNPAERTELGETTTGLYKIWFPAFQTEYQDEFGYPDEEKAKRIQSIRRRNLRRDQEALQQYILQYPWEEAEMFSVDGSNCQYNREILRERERFINDPGNIHIVRRGNFRPKDGNIGDPIIWEDDDLGGRWEVSKFLDESDDSSNKANKPNRFLAVHRLGKTEFRPLNSEYFVGGFDPTRSHSNPNKVRSCAGGSILGKENFWDVDMPNFVADYVWKPDDPEVAYMDMLYACMYYGCWFLVESTIGILSVLRRHGCEAFMMSRPESTFLKKKRRMSELEEEGIPATMSINDYLLKRKKTWMHANAYKLVQPRIIRTSLAFNIAERTKYDLEVASQLAIVGSEKPVIHVDKTPIDIGNMFGSFDNSGTFGKIN